jgi:hypothetical protein
MPIRKSTLLNGAPKRPTPPTPHPEMHHISIIGGQKSIVRGVTSTQLAHMLRCDQVHAPSIGKRLAPVATNPGCRDRNNDSATGIVAPAAIVERAAPGATKSRRV